MELVAPLRQDLKVGILEQLLPNQDGILKSPADLYIDRDVDEELKMISASVGLGLTAKLLDKRILEGAGSERNELIGAFVHKHIDTTSALKQVIEDIRLKITSLTQQPRQNRSILGSHLAVALAKLTVWCAMHRPVYDSLAKELPILTEEGRFENWTDRYICLLPVPAWATEAQQYADIFPESRKLASVYWQTAADNSEILREALVEWGVCPEGLVLVTENHRMSKEIVQTLRCSAGA